MRVRHRGNRKGVREKGRGGGGEAEDERGGGKVEKAAQFELINISL